MFIEKHSPVIPQTMVCDPDLSLKAKGLYVVLFQIYRAVDVRGIVSEKQAERSAILNELIAAGWVEKDETHITLLACKSKPRVAAEPKKPVQTKPHHQYLEERRQEKAEFVALAMAAIEKMAPPKMPEPELKNFVGYWCAIDSINPSKPLPYKALKGKNKNFNMTQRMRTWMRNNAQYSTKKVPTQND